ncbi:hypothetical protein [Flagellimonas sp. GZD32]|uniref:hypothetical protein n=1 Tax=Flagellimonas cixiensis TaxID=3228750 RepID=UPI0035C8FBF1
MLNFSKEKPEITLDKKWSNHTVLINNYSGLDYIDKTIILKPYQAVILYID